MHCDRPETAAGMASAEGLRCIVRCGAHRLLRAAVALCDRTRSPEPTSVPDNREGAEGWLARRLWGQAHTAGLSAPADRSRRSRGEPTRTPGSLWGATTCG